MVFRVPGGLSQWYLTEQTSGSMLGPKDTEFLGPAELNITRPIPVVLTSSLSGPPGLLLVLLAKERAVWCQDSNS